LSLSCNPIPVVVVVVVVVANRESWRGFRGRRGYGGDPAEGGDET
jgi:hypothetical protein